MKRENHFGAFQTPPCGFTSVQPRCEQTPSLGSDHLTGGLARALLQGLNSLCFSPFAALVTVIFGAGPQEEQNLIWAFHFMS